MLMLTAKSEEKDELSVDALKALLSMLASAMEEMDIGGADEAIEKLSSYQLPDDLQDDMEQLRSAVADFDQVRVSVLLETMGHVINGEKI